MKKINWEQYFMAMVKITAMRSKDPNTQVGAVIINDNKRIIATGYNGMPLGDDSFPWNRKAPHAKDTKYPYVIHAELNAILNSEASTKKSTMFVSLFPCSSCAKLIVQSGIKQIYFADDKYKDTEDNEVSKIILKKGNVPFQYLPSVDVAIKI